MNKILIAFASAVFAVATLFAPSAHAGSKGKLAVGLAIGALHVLSHQRRYERRHYRKRRHQVRRRIRRKKKTHVTKSSTSKSSEVAKAEEVPALPVKKSATEGSSISTAGEAAAPAKFMAETENSSIATAALKATDAEDKETPKAKAAAPAKVATDSTQQAKKDDPETPANVDCKKFFPSVGLTLTVPCE